MLSLIPNAEPSSASSLPAKLVLEWRVAPPNKPAFERCLAELMALARRYPLEGSSVLATAEGEYLVLLRFATPAHLELWQSAPEVVEALRAAQALANRADAPVVRTGLETWFTLPEHGARGLPPKWKMALVTWCALLPQVVLLSFILPSGLPFLLGVAVSTAIPVVTLTWWVMPNLTRLLEAWLFAERAPAGPAARAERAPASES